MKQLLPLFLFLLPCLAWAQYPSNGNQKITLGEQTTADGLIWRGVAADTTLTTKSDTAAYFVLDTVNINLYTYKASATGQKWRQLGADTASIAYVNTYGDQTVNGVKTFSSTVTGARFDPTSSSASGNGMYLPAANTLGFTTSSINRVIINSTGVGIGVSPDYKFHVLATSGASMFLQNTVTNPKVYIGEGGGVSQYGVIGWNSTDNYTFLESQGSRPLILSSGIEGSGNVGIGITPTEKLHVGGTIKQTGGDGFVLVNGAYTSNIFSSPSTGDMFIDYPSGEELRIRNSGATTNMVLSNNGDVKINNLANASNPVNVQVDVNGVLIRSSSIELKDNVQNLPYGLNDLLLLKPYKFNYKDKYKFGEGYDIGFIAEDVNDIVPEAVGTGVNSDIFMDSVKLIPILTKAIQEQQTLIKALEQRIINLENK
jgi:hypothetical protein